MAASETILPAPALLHAPFFADGQLFASVIVGFVVKGRAVEPLYWPEPPAGAEMMLEIPGRGWECKGVRAETPERLAQHLRERLS